MDIARLLAEEAEVAEQTRDHSITYTRNRSRSKEPAQVYSLRVPVDRLEELRQVAAAQHLAPSALMRRWVLDRLDQEQDMASRRDEAAEEHGDDVVVVTRERYESDISQGLALAREEIDAAVAKEVEQRLAPLVQQIRTLVAEAPEETDPQGS
jgi:hypothetical protein